MQIQVLIATMNQTREDYSILKRMNIQTDALIGNQCQYNEITGFDYDGHRIKCYSLNEHGVGLNRNTTLMRSTGEVVLFADDDMIYVDGYSDIISNAFEQLPNADLIIFNLKSNSKNFQKNTYVKRVRWYNFMRYGTAQIAARQCVIKENGIYFNQCFGGGTEHSSGEDSLFLADCIKKGLRIYAVPIVIATLTEERESTWFNGYTTKYLLDKGILYKTMFKHFWKLLCLQDAIRHQKLYNRYFYETYQIMVKRYQQQK